MQSNLKIYLYVIVMTGITAAVLSFLYNSLEPLQAKNREDAKKKSILASLPDVDASNISLFDKNIKTTILDAEGKEILSAEASADEKKVTDLLQKLNKRGEGVKYLKLIDVDLALEDKFPLEKRIYPAYSYSDGKNTYQIVCVRGNGLWDKIWGYISLSYKDKWTVAGVNFEHKAETPGLGAEIKDSKAFKDQFKSKQIFDNDGKYVSVAVVKAPKYKDWEVKSISGATVTSVGVSEMMIKGISNYLNFLDKAKPHSLTSK